MRKLLIAGLVAGTALTFAPAAYAAPDPSGILCGFSSTTDPQVEGSQTGEVDAGPILLGDDTDPTVVYSGSVTCTIQVNAATHAGADACAVTGPNGTAVIAAAGTCTYATTSGDNVYLCTQVNIDGGPTLYFADSNDPLVEGEWSTDPNSACGLATSVDPGPIGGELDPLLCPILAILFPPEGDILNIWDCPPYNN